MNPTRNRPVIACSVPVTSGHRDVVEGLLRMLKPVHTTRFNPASGRLDVCFNGTIDSGWFIDFLQPLLRDALGDRIKAEDVIWYEEPVVPDQARAQLLIALVELFACTRDSADEHIPGADIWARQRQTISRMQRLTMQVLDPDNARDAWDIKP